MRATYKMLLQLLVFNAVFTTIMYSQQVADSAFTFPIAQPSYSFGTGPVITLDEAHYNFHTLSGRYYPFGKFLAQDGYQLRSGTEPFSKEGLGKTDILVIANALADDGDWVLPTNPAFEKNEVRSVAKWVKQGGSLFLIADHMPFPGAAIELAAAFGFTFINGFAMRNDAQPEVFSRTRGNLQASEITNGRTSFEQIDSIALFTGHGFMSPSSATPFLVLDTSYLILIPERAWVFDDNTERRSGEGLVIGSSLNFGKGRVVVVGEAAMFTAQLAGTNKAKIGMNNSRAAQNPQLLLNIMHWLDRIWMMSDG